MADLQRIQNQIDQIPALLQDVADLKPVPGPKSVPAFGPLEPSYAAEDLITLETHIEEWKAATAEILREECGKEDTTRFLNLWSAPIRPLSYKEHFTKKLQNSGKYLRTLIVTLKEKEQYRTTLNDIWALVHPDIEAISRKRFEEQFYADAVEAACKALNARVRDIVKARTGEELDGAKLMQKAFSVDRPIIRIAPGETVSDRDTQQGYMQIFSGVMTGIRNPKAHDNETITRDDALRKLIMLSILMYKIDNSK